MLSPALALALAAALAPATVDLEWSAPPGCPARDAVAAATTRLLTRPASPGFPFSCFS